MKRFYLLNLLSVMIYCQASAHSGMYDRYLGSSVSIGTLCCVVAITHLLCFIIIRRVRSSKLLRLKKCIVAVSTAISTKEWVACIAGWLLFTITWGTYLGCFLNIFDLLAFIPFWVIWVILSVNIFNSKKRSRLFTSRKAIAKMIFTSIYQVIGIIVYSLICESPVLHSFVYYTDAEYDSYGLILYPGIEGVLYDFEWMINFACAFAVPFFMLMLYKCSNKIKRKWAQGR